MVARSLVIRSVALAGGIALGFRLLPLNLPGDDRGYSPAQPIAFSHRLHAGDMELNCQYCHTGAGKSRHAGVPSPNTCMNCHGQVTAGKAAADRDKAAVSPELQKLYDAVAFDPHTKTYDDSRPTHPLEWIKVHDLPDFVCFDHSRHVTAGVQCQQCHGEVQTMDRVTQVRGFLMGFCVNCHRDVSAGHNPNPALHGLDPSIDCGACHY
jgi:hypothetical protein